MKRIEGSKDIWRSNFRYQTPRTLWHRFWREVFLYGLGVAIVAGVSLWVISRGY